LSDEKTYSISVVIPTFNRAHCIKRAVDSVLQQTFPVSEVLICDDGSTDNTREVIAAYRSEKIKWIDCGRNGMPAIPRNTGIKIANGNWIAFIDSDDEWLPEKLEIQLKEIKNTNALAASTNAFRIVNAKKVGTYLSYSKKKITLSDLIPVNEIITSSVLINKKLLEETSLFPEEKNYVVGEDYALWLRVSTKTDFAFISQLLLNYHDNPQSSIRAHSTDEWTQKEIILTGFRNWVKQHKIILDKSIEKLLSIEDNKIATKGKVSVFKKIIRKLKS
jgi:teichuronic acid biosynthesis glycosyltransferase TuaG